VTGTAVGDPIECEAIGPVFSRPNGVIIGSVKGNLGSFCSSSLRLLILTFNIRHLEISAFSVALVKACLIFENKVIPPNVNFGTPNPKIPWEKYGLKVPTEQTPLGCCSASGKSLISLASSGIGGSNGHVVVESPPSPSYSACLLLPDTPVLFAVGGLSPRAAQEIAESLLSLLLEDSSINALSQAVTHARRARQLPWRTIFTYTPGSPDAPKIPNPELISKHAPRLVFVFSGQGPQHINMGRYLFRAYQVFRDTILELDAIYKNVVGVSMIESTGLFAGQDTSLLPSVWSASVTIPAITMVEIALYDLMKSIGLTADILVGHSAGETALIYASGAGSKAMALEISIARSRAMVLSERLDAGMAALACDADLAQTIIERVKPEGVTGVLEIACYNSPSAVVLSGSGHLVVKAVEAAQLVGVFSRKLTTLNPSHSSLMEVCRDEFFEGVQDIFSRYEGSHVPKIPTYSSVAGQERLIKEFTPAYLWSNVKSPVHFHQAVSSILKETGTGAAFVEISPHPVLSNYITALEPTLIVACPMRRPSKNASGSNVELAAFSGAIGRLITLGIDTVDLTPLYGRASRDRAYDIPYPFTTRHFPLRVDGPRQVQSSSGPCSLRQKMNARTHSDLAQHVINGEPIIPAAAYIDMVRLCKFLHCHIIIYSQFALCSGSPDRCSIFMGRGIQIDHISGI
jgi:acyl transferase domain-containing protein